MSDAYQPGEVHEPAPIKPDVQILREFAEWVIREGCWDGTSLDGGDIQSMAEHMGLLSEHEVSANEVGRFGDCEEGDTAYIFSGPLGPSDERPL